MVSGVLARLSAGAVVTKAGQDQHAIPERASDSMISISLKPVPSVAASICPS
jgi:hypothetical protein